MSNSQDRARVRARTTTGPGDGLDGLPAPALRFALATRPEAALVGWSTASAAGTLERRGPQTDHLAALVRRARRRESRRRLLRLWIPRGRRKVAAAGHTRGLGLSESSVRSAVQSALTAALPGEAVRGGATGASQALWQMSPHPAHPLVNRRANVVDRRRGAAGYDGPDRRGSHGSQPTGRRIPEQRSQRAAARER
ncbi:MAG: hypothetical protein ACJ71T_03745 [Actinomycetales bacterium]